MNTARKLTILVLILLAICGIAALLLGGFMPVFSIAFGLLFVYYGLIYLLIRCLKNKRRYAYMVYILMALPILWAIADLEGFFNFLLEGIHLDMK